MNQFKENFRGILLSLCIAVPSALIGKRFPVIGGAVIAILLGMFVAPKVKGEMRARCSGGIRFVSKKVLQWAVVLLGFGMNLEVVAATGKESLPIIVCTITTSLVIAAVLRRVMKIPYKTATLVGVGSSICGGSAIAAAAPAVGADDDEVAQAISVIFFYNVLAAMLFPAFGKLLGFDTLSGNAFGVFAGTAINDTSSVTAAAATWDGMWHLGTQTLDKAVTVKLTRTLAIIPITLGLSFIRAKREEGGSRFRLKDALPTFILFFIGASLVTTILIGHGVDPAVFAPIKRLSKFFVVWAMAAIGLNTDIVKLFKTGGKPLIMGGCCSVGITVVSLVLQKLLHIW